MISPRILPTLLTIPIVQMCIRMIPPEDVSVGTISATLSTTQASPITTGQCTASSCQESTTIPIGGTPVTGSPMTNTPATVTTAPVTMAPGSLCTNCDIATIAPAMEANTVFENTNTVEADGCTQTNVICRRTDDQTCTGVTLSATNAAGTTTVSSAMNTNQVSGSLTCQADGTYSSGSVTGISKLVCTFDTCVPACSTCNIEAARPVMDPPNTVFQTMDNTPAGQTCKVYTVSCVHQTQLCTIVIYATMSTGSEEMLGSDIDTNFKVASINCATDGTLRFMGRLQKEAYLLGMPDVVTNEILKNLDFATIRKLQKVCHAFRDFVDCVKPDSHLKSIDLEVVEELIFVSFSTPSQSNEEVEISFEDVVDFLWAALKYQKSLLDELRFVSFVGKAVELKNAETFEKLFDRLMKILKSRDRLLQVEALPISVHGQDQLMQLLSHVDLKILKSLEVFGLLEQENSLDHGDDDSELVLDLDILKECKNLE